MAVKRSPALYAQPVEVSVEALRRDLGRLNLAFHSNKFPQAEELTRRLVRHSNDLRILVRLARGADA